MSQRRAISDDQKQVRRQMILDTAWAMFQRTNYTAIVMSDVAHEAGLAKGTVYLYFKTKEALFVAVLSQQFSAWFDDLDARLAAAPNSTREAVVAAIVASFAARNGMTRLLAILHTVLEHNIDHATMLAFKRLLHERIQRSGALLTACLPRIGNGAAVLMQAYALVIGFEHVANPVPLAREVMQQEAMQLFEVDFATAFSTTLSSLLAGIEAQAANQTH